MPGAVEITLFRVSQEMMIKDVGCDIPPDVFARFQTNGSNVAVGLVGMRERVHEPGGHVNIQSGSDGTTIGPAWILGTHLHGLQFRAAPGVLEGFDSIFGCESAHD